MPEANSRACSCIIRAFTESPPTFFGRAGEAGAAVPTTCLEDLHPYLAAPGRPAKHAIYPFDWSRILDLGIEVLFLATPHEQSREWAPAAIRHGIKVIDLSGAWRLHDSRNREVYKLHDPDPTTAAQLQSEAVYGCPELHREAIRRARLVANPGCYPTSIILALAPPAPGRLGRHRPRHHLRR